MNKAHPAWALLGALLISTGAYAVDLHKPGQPKSPNMHDSRHDAPHSQYHSHAPHAQHQPAPYRKQPHKHHHQSRHADGYHEERSSFHPPRHPQAKPHYQQVRPSFHVPGAKATVQQRQVSPGLREVRTSFHIPHSQQQYRTAPPKKPAHPAHKGPHQLHHGGPSR